MLVLSRKMGEQIVLPGCGVVISVVKVAGKRVRLGIVAPPDAPIHRAEVWDRMSEANGSQKKPVQASDRAAPAAGRQPSPQGATPLGTAEAPLELGQHLADCIAERTGGRIRALSVESADGRVIVHGRAGSYYARQLAFAAVSQALEGLGHDSGEEVQLDIEVAAG